jgi:hypothetical protein
LKRKKTRKTADLARCTGDRYLWDAGDRASYAGDDDGKYRPQESPANRYINDDAGGILLDVVILHALG